MVAEGILSYVGSMGYIRFANPFVTYFESSQGIQEIINLDLR